MCASFSRFCTGQCNPSSTKIQAVACLQPLSSWRHHFEPWRDRPWSHSLMRHSYSISSNASLIWTGWYNLCKDTLDPHGLEMDINCQTWGPAWNGTYGLAHARPYYNGHDIHLDLFYEDTYTHINSTQWTCAYMSYLYEHLSNLKIDEITIKDWD
jgi:hypothetical protein